MKLLYLFRRLEFVSSHITRPSVCVITMPLLRYHLVYCSECRTLDNGLCIFCIWVVGLCVVVWREGGALGSSFYLYTCFSMRCQVLYSQFHIHVYYYHLCSHVFSLLQAIQRHQAAHLVKDKSFTTRYVVSKGGGKDGRETMCSTHKVSFCVAGITFFSVRVVE